MCTYAGHEEHITCAAISKQEEILVSFNDEFIYLFDQSMSLGASPQINAEDSMKGEDEGPHPNLRNRKYSRGIGTIRPSRASTFLAQTQSISSADQTVEEFLSERGEEGSLSPCPRETSQLRIVWSLTRMLLFWLLVALTTRSKSGLHCRTPFLNFQRLLKKYIFMSNYSHEKLIAFYYVVLDHLSPWPMEYGS
jgi:hypothetical protein